MGRLLVNVVQTSETVKFLKITKHIQLAGTNMSVVSPS